MIRKLFFLALIAYVGFMFYKKFMAPVMEPGLKAGAGNVDFFGKKHQVSMDSAVPEVK